MALRGGVGASQLLARGAEAFVVQPEPRRGAGDEQVVPAAAERERRLRRAPGTEKSSKRVVVEWSTNSGESEPPVITNCRDTELARSRTPWTAVAGSRAAFTASCSGRSALVRSMVGVPDRGSGADSAASRRSIGSRRSISLLSKNRPVIRSPASPSLTTWCARRYNRPASLQALDQRAVPGCMVGVEGNGFEEAHQIEHLPKGPGSADRSAAQVMGGVGRVVFEPRRRRVPRKKP